MSLLLLIIHLCYISSLLAGVGAQQQQVFVNDNTNRFSGGLINSESTVTLPASSSPYEISRDIIVERNSKLIIEAGCELRFLPRVGITIRGAIKAKGNAQQKIVFTRSSIISPPSSTSDYKYTSKQPEISTVQWPDVRLVDGDLPSEGRLQINYKGKWHSVCTNSKNWTDVDIDIVCRQLGFKDGVWYHWFHKFNDSRQFLYENPNCKGHESDVQNCPNWHQKKIGSGICDYHTDIGIRCSQTLYPSPNYWRGLEFINAQMRNEHQLTNKWKRRVSQSVLEHVSIHYAGEGKEGNATSAIHVIGIAPRMNEVQVKWSAFNAINITNANSNFRDAIDIRNSEFTQNRGYGIYVNSSYGRVSLTGVHVENNGADGVRYVFHHQPEFSKESFCHTPNLEHNQVYPTRLTHTQTKDQTSTKECCQEFYGDDWAGQKLTVHFPYLMSVDGDEKDRPRMENGSIYVIDGYSLAKIADFTVWNDTRPQSVSSFVGRGPMKICYRPAVYRTVMFTVEVVIDYGRAYDLNITDSRISRNNGRGVWVQNQRSGTVVNRTVISDNSYVAGVHLIGGSGDVIVNNSYIVQNAGDGINISLSGGFKHIDRSHIENNTLRGIAIWFNETDSQIAFNFSTKVTFSYIIGNGDIGLLLGNVCRSDAFWNITMNTFRQNQWDAIEFLSCWRHSDFISQTNLLITHNKFEANLRRAITIAPVFHLQAQIEYNFFTLHQTGVIYINSREIIGDDFEFEDVPAEVTIRENEFRTNRGMYVANIGVHEESTVQKLLFSLNILEENMITEPFLSLNPRSRVAAVVVVSSSNTKVVRNRFLNPESRFELGSHLELHSRIINASYNYWGPMNALEIYDRIFDRKNRYNIAQIEFLQYLTLPEDLHSYEAVSYDRDRDKLMHFPVNLSEIGGEVRGPVFLEQKTYVVRKDIYIRPGAKLVIPEGAELQFDQSIGIMAQGRLEARGGSGPRMIRFTAVADIAKPRVVVMKAPTFTKPVTSFTQQLSNLTKISISNKTLTNNKTLSTNTTLPLVKPRRIAFAAPMTSVRLSNITYGRLEVRVGGQWGSVCAYGFDIEDAAIACQQLGYILNERDWLLENSQFTPFVSSNRNVLLSNLQCNHLDTDITSCKGQRYTDNDFEASCPEEVGIRCYPPSWAGIRIGMLSEDSIIENVIIERAGLLDYSLHLFKPALQIDFNRFQIRNVQVHENSDAGLGIMWNDVFTHQDSFNIFDSYFTTNFYHGIMTRSQGMKAKRCVFQDNRGSGFHYEPMFTNWEQKELVTWVAPPDPSAIYYLPGDKLSDTLRINPYERKFWYVKVKKNPGARAEDYHLTVQTYTGFAVGIMVLNPIFEDSTENITIQGPTMSTWDLRLNLTAFPLLYPGYKVNIVYRTGERPKGGVILYLTSKQITPQKPYLTQEQQQFHEQRQMTTILLQSCTFIGNYRGISSNHYNRDVSFRRDYYHRYSNESISLKLNTIQSSEKESLFINTPFYDPLEFTLAEINYTLIENQFSKNGGGIVQYSRDIRSSNNLFHWVLNDSLIDDNIGGFRVKLPYVWQYNENFTHSLSIHNNTFFRNKNFEFNIDGHFARFNMSENKFSENQCKAGLITIAGMEKEMLILDNLMHDNTVRYVVDLNLQSHADQFGTVTANFQRNRIQSNRKPYDQRSLDKYNPETYALALRGVQEVNITNNVFENPNLQYEFIAGVQSGSIETEINVAQNWWGTTDPLEIRNRIFDFDDWNNFAPALFSPFSSYPSVDSMTKTADELERPIDLNLPLGGRLYSDLILHWRSYPYVIKSDLTVMPEVTLTIYEGVQMEFEPGVGLLVLGELKVIGSESSPVRMSPHKQITGSRLKRHLPKTPRAVHFDTPYAIGLGDVRLCITEGCEENAKSKRRNGFVEVFNLTTLQWSPICDKRFTERNAQVVCRQLGYSTLNVYLSRDRRLDMGQTLISRIRHWPEPLECIGKEEALSECDLRLNGYGNHSHACYWDSEEFVYISCGEDNKEPDEEYWGGIRFALKSFERKSEGVPFPTRMYYGTTSNLQFLHIRGAGILHGEKNAAIQLIQRDVNLEYVKVENCASHAIEVIAPPGHLIFHKLELYDNLGSGLNYVLLSGSSTESQTIPYKPLGISGLPYKVFGMLDICDTSKELVIDERILLYYKYDNKPVDCVKIFNTAHSAKRIGFRLLQFNLFDSYNYTAQPDSLKVWDGDIFNQTTEMIGEIGVTPQHRLERPERLFYASTEYSLSIQLHATGASGDYGFIAEVATLPASYFVGRGLFHNITYSEIKRNTLAALQYHSAGESTPTVAMHHNIITDNCNQLFGNFTTCEAALYLELQNSQYFYFHNNLVKGNQGGIHVYANSQSAVASLTGLLFNNLFEANLNNEVVLFQGPQLGSAYQTVDIVKNYFTRNRCPFKTNIVLSQVVANFTENVIVSNYGQHQMSVIGFERIPLFYQTCKSNWFYNNVAVKDRERSTVIASNAGQVYLDNYFVNPENDFELSTMNRTDLYSIRNPPIKAIYNWWGFNESSAVEARIRDYKDYYHLVPVEYIPFHVSNTSVLSGICAGGWEKIGDTCFTYIGARMTYREAMRFCEMENASMPFIRVNHEEVWRYVYTRQDWLERRYHRVWVQSFEYDSEQCTVLVWSRIRTHDCQERFPFLCEKSPEIRVSHPYWYREPLGIAALTISSITAFFTLICISCWLCKSRHRYKEKLQRRNSIRASIRSNRSMSLSSSVNTLSEAGYRRQIEKAIQAARTQQQLQQQQQMQPTSSTTLVKPSSGSFDSVEKNQFVAESSCDTQSYQTSARNDDYSDLNDRFVHDPQLENENINILVHPTFDLTFQNDGFRATPSNISQQTSPSSQARGWSPSTVDTTVKQDGVSPASSPTPYESYGMMPTSRQFHRPAPSPPPARHYLQSPQHSNLLTFQSPSKSSLHQNGHVSPAYAGGSSSEEEEEEESPTQRRQYLETSLDGDSYTENIYDDYQLNRLSPTVSTATINSSTTSRSRPLETAM